jgi:hypothetical protein
VLDVDVDQRSEEAAGIQQVGGNVVNPPARLPQRLSGSRVVESLESVEEQRPVQLQDRARRYD